MRSLDEEPFPFLQEDSLCLEIPDFQQAALVFRNQSDGPSLWYGALPDSQASRLDPAFARMPSLGARSLLKLPK